MSTAGLVALEIYSDEYHGQHVVKMTESLFESYFPHDINSKELLWVCDFRSLEKTASVNLLYETTDLHEGMNLL
jgi:hypothetical protein